MAFTDDSLLKDVYEQAWGKAWPRHTATISYSDISAGDIDTEQFYGPLATDVESARDTPLTYVCLTGIDRLVKAIRAPTRASRALIVLSDYVFLLDSIEKTLAARDGSAAFVVTGHPGTGMCSVSIFTSIDLTLSHFLL
jgi:hypothetical protein